MTEPLPDHHEAILEIVSSLMQGAPVSLSRLGAIQPEHRPSRSSGTSLLPPSTVVTFVHRPTVPESETPSARDFLSRHIREGLATSGRCTVAGLGVFEHTVDGAVAFRPATELSDVVNYRFGHLDAHDAPSVPTPLPEEERPVEPLVTEDRRPAEPVLTEEPVIVQEAATVEEQALEPIQEPTPAPEPEPEPALVAPAAPARRTPASLDRRRRNPWVVAALILLPIAVAATLWMGRQSDPVSEMGSQPLASDTTTVPDEPVAQGDSVLTDDASNPTDTVPADTVRATPPPVVLPPAVTAERTDALQRGMDGYTLIISSTNSLTAARALIDDYAGLSLPSGVLEYESDGAVLYRVGVGQWDTAALADSARMALGTRLPEGTWVRRLN